MLTIYVAAWHVKSESGDDYMGQVVLENRVLDHVLENIISNCPEVDAMLCDSNLDLDLATPEEVLNECLLFPDIVWVKIDGNGAWEEV